jgi:hypothetical protein
MEDIKNGEHQKIWKMSKECFLLVRIFNLGMFFFPFFHSWHFVKECNFDKVPFFFRHKKTFYNTMTSKKREDRNERRKQKQKQKR